MMVRKTQIKAVRHASHHGYLGLFTPFTLNNTIKTKVTDIFLLLPKLTWITLCACGKPQCADTHHKEYIQYSY